MKCAFYFQLSFAFFAKLLATRKLNKQMMPSKKTKTWVQQTNMFDKIFDQYIFRIKTINYLTVIKYSYLFLCQQFKYFTSISQVCENYHDMATHKKTQRKFDAQFDVWQGSKPEKIGQQTKERKIIKQFHYTLVIIRYYVDGGFLFTLLCWP